MSKQTAALKRVITKVGSKSILARLLEIDRRAVQQWKHIPLQHLREIERATGIPRAELRPDIFS